MKRKFIVVMILCFVFGGYFILSYVSQVYSIYMRAGFADIIGNGNISDMFNESFRVPARGFNESFRPPQMGREFQLGQLFSPNELIYLLGGVMFIVAGVSIWHLVREKEIATLKEELTNMFLLPEEKNVMDELKKAGGELTQRELARKTGLSKVKVHRVLNKLEAKRVIKRHPYGVTKKVVIEKKFHGN